MDDEVLAAEEPISVRVPAESHGARLDATAASLFPQFSRSRLAEWIKEGRLLRNRLTAKPRDKVVVDDELYLEPESEDRVEWGAEDLPLDILYEDHHVVVINKPAIPWGFENASAAAATLNALPHGSITCAPTSEGVERPLSLATARHSRIFDVLVVRCVCACGACVRAVRCVCSCVREPVCV